MIIRASIFMIILYHLVTPLVGQEPFDCDGNYYLILRDDPTQQSKLFRVENRQDLSGIIFEEVGPDSAGLYLNSIGYRRTDNFIYGIDPENFDLYKIDNKGIGFYLDDLEELDTLNSYIAGDISLDGNHLIIIERERINNTRQDVALNFIDLTDPEFSIDRVLITDEEGETPIIRSGDVAIHPFTGLMYGYNDVEKKLITFELETGIVNSEDFITAEDQPRTLGALFFDEFGRLLGYGRHPDSLRQNTLYQIDINTGLGEELKTGPSARGIDGCRCIEQIGLQKSVQPFQTIPCTEVTYTIYISNSTGNILENIVLKDALNFNLEFQSLDYNPFSGNFSFDSLSNTLQISDLILPPGVDSIVLTVFVKPTAEAGTINNQAEITNLTAGQESIIYSDYPLTFEEKDPTPLEILASLEVSEIFHDRTICLGEELTLISEFPNAEYLWDDFEEETTDRITIETGGIYVLTTVIGCQIITEIFQVTEESINFSLGGNQFIDLGESITISPTIQSTSSDSIYQWTGNSSEICLDCPIQNFIPLENDKISLTITNQAGCINQDSINIFVNTDRTVFVPNAFSPNSDGNNDLLFVSTKIPQQILYFRIYNRWGALVFENKNGQTNDSTFGLSLIHI